MSYNTLMFRNKQKLLYLGTAFASGFSLMVIELTASRIAAGLIGSSLYTWTSIIGVVLFGGAMGNIFGGIIIDKYKHPLTLYWTLLSASISTLTIFPAKAWVANIISTIQSPLLMALIAALVMFFLPSFLLGAIYPSLYKLFISDLDAAGKQSATVSSGWTIGSIAGTFATGYVLIGNIGSTKTISLTAIILLLNAAFVLFFLAKTKLTMRLILPIVVSAGIITIFVLKNETGNNTFLFNKESSYYLIRVLDKKISGVDYRLLVLDIDSHSMERVDGAKMGSYTEIAPVFSKINDNIGNILVIGAGSEKLSRNLQNTFPDSKTTTLEIDPEVVRVASEYFKNNLPSMETKIADARPFLKTNNQEYDLIFSDAYNSFISVPTHLTTQEFAKIVYSRLSNEGIYAVNMISSLSGNNSGLYKSMLKTLSSVFGDCVVLAYGKNSEDTQNIVIVSRKGGAKLSANELSKKMLTMRDGPAYAQRVITDKNMYLFDGKNPLLTDDFAPIEKLMAGNIAAYYPKYISMQKELYNN